jgi:hypothetical protein
MDNQLALQLVSHHIKNVQNKKRHGPTTIHTFFLFYCNQNMYISIHIYTPYKKKPTNKSFLKLKLKR